RFDQVKVGVGAQVGRSRLYRLRFTDIANPTLGGTIAAVLDGTEIGNMMDNMNIDKHGHVFIQEDPGNQAYSAKLLQYDIATDQVTVIAKHDSTRFGDIGITATAPFSQDEESSGIIDISEILGEGMHLFVQQSHYSLPSPLIEGGQLLTVFIPSSIGVASTAADTVVVCATSAPSVNLGTPATGDNCTIATTVNNAPTTFPLGTTTPVTWTVTDVNGNVNTATQYVKVNTGSTVTLAQYGGITSGTGVTTLTQACAGTPVILAATTSGPNVTNYQWQRNGVDLVGQTNDSLTVSSGWGVYRVRVNNLNACLTNADTFSVSFRSLPNAQAGTDKNVCEGSTATLGTTNNASFTYSWFPTAGLSNASISNPVVTTTTGSTTYTVHVSQAVANSGGLVCSKSDAVVVNTLTPPAAPTIAVALPATLVGNANPSLCEGSGAITLAASGTSGATQLQWLRNGTQVTLTSNLSSNLNVSNTSGIAVNYTAKVRASNGCFSPASNVIAATIKPAAMPIITPAGTNNIILLCFNGATSASQVLTASVTSGTPSYSWYQTGLTGFIGTLNTYNAVISNTTTSRTFNVKANYANGCIRTSVNKVVRKNTTCREDMTGVEEIVSEEMTAYPNPTSDKLNVAINNSVAFGGKLTLSNALGQIIMSQNIDLTEGNAMETLDMSNLPQGVYHLTFDTETTHKVVKVVKE
ncbi:MAG: T9SS type A sorting domain-containing protein, partial [Bacteroidia bacterium]